MVRVIKIGGEEGEILRQKCEGIDFAEFHDFLMTLNEMLARIRDKKNGAVGLALPQVGYAKRGFVVDFKDKKGKQYTDIFINPVYLDRSDQKLIDREVCLSEPGVKKIIRRHRKVKIGYIDRSGRDIVREFEGYAARVVQHEMDHLEGILLSDQ